MISLALMHVAEGRTNAAQALLQEHKDSIPAGDYGLALALAGDTKSGVEVLGQLIRSGENTAKVRQNLAFAYALDGRWREAQIMAGQDLDPQVAQDRIAEWARIAHPDAHAQRVASVLGVTPVAGDPGQPVMLALSATPSMAQVATEIGQQAMASAPAAGPIELPPVQDAPMELAGVESVPVPASEPAPVYAEAAPAVAPAPSGAIVAPLLTAREIVQPLPPAIAARRAQAAPRNGREAPDDRRAGKGSGRFGSCAQGRACARQARHRPRRIPEGELLAGERRAFAVQLGVFSSTANANRAWVGYSAKHKDLAAFSKVAVPVTVGGRALHRLTANGFADEKSARAMCAQVRSGGGECIIARATSTKPAGTQIAARR